MSHKRINLVFNMKTDMDLYDFLSKQTNKSAYVKEAVEFYRSKHEIITDVSLLKKVIREVLSEVLGNQIQVKARLNDTTDQVSDEVLNLIMSMG